MSDTWYVLQNLEQLNLDDVKEPPCGKCYWWDPAFEYGADGRTGVAFCRADEMECDFSCFRPRRSPKGVPSARDASARGAEGDSDQNPEQLTD